MFAFVVRRLYFLKDIPLLPVFYDSLMKLWYFFTMPEVLDCIDELERSVLQMPDGVLYEYLQTREKQTVFAQQKSLT